MDLIVQDKVDYQELLSVVKKKQIDFRSISPQEFGNHMSKSPLWHEIHHTEKLKKTKEGAYVMRRTGTLYKSLLSGQVVKIQSGHLQNAQIEKIIDVIKDHEAVLKSLDFQSIEVDQNFQKLCQQYQWQLVESYKNAINIAAFLQAVQFRMQDGIAQVGCKKGLKNNEVSPLLVNGAWAKNTRKGKSGHDPYFHVILGKSVGLSGHIKNITPGTAVDLCVKLQAMVNELRDKILTLPQSAYVASEQNLHARVKNLPPGSFVGLKGYLEKVIRFSVIRLYAFRERGFYR